MSIVGKIKKIFGAGKQKAAEIVDTIEDKLDETTIDDHIMAGLAKAKGVGTAAVEQVKDTAEDVVAAAKSAKATVKARKAEKKKTKKK